MKRLADKVALVTGGSRGIGAAVVSALTDEGANVGVNYLHSRTEAETICEAIRREKGVTAIPVRADVSVPGDVKDMIDTMLETFGRIDILVNNAGVTCRGTLSEISVEDWNRTISTDLTGVFLCCKYALPSMLERGEGRIINVSSQLGQIGYGGHSAYCAAKGGVIAFTKSLAREVARSGILVNSVAPGLTDTDMIADISPERRRERADLLPLGRIGTPEEVAPAVVFLATSDGDLFVGQTLGPNSGDVML